MCFDRGLERDEAVEVVVTGRQVETLRLESLVEVVSHLDEDS